MAVCAPLSNGTVTFFSLKWKVASSAPLWIRVSCSLRCPLVSSTSALRSRPMFSPKAMQRSASPVQLDSDRLAHSAPSVTSAHTSPEAMMLNMASPPAASTTASFLAQPSSVTSENSGLRSHDASTAKAASIDIDLYNNCFIALTFMFYSPYSLLVSTPPDAATWSAGIGQ